MAEDLVPFTKAGYDRLQAELAQLKNIERHAVIQDIATARSHGDLKENAEYSAAREKQGFIEGRINELEGQLSRANVLDFSSDPAAQGQVRFGAKVTVEDLNSGDKKTLHVVGDLEADIKENRISLSSPIAKALLGKKIDDIVEVQAPKGLIEYQILQITY
ncbi:MAG: transcription elongation factor GreA [Proteobacteria bacterium]|nr:transcription elongation factor GreA [Pseudomonadota bacterium]